MFCFLRITNARLSKYFHDLNVSHVSPLGPCSRHRVGEHPAYRIKLLMYIHRHAPALLQLCLVHLDHDWFHTYLQNVVWTSRHQPWKDDVLRRGRIRNSSPCCWTYSWCVRKQLQRFQLLLAFLLPLFGLGHAWSRDRLRSHPHCDHACQPEDCVQGEKRIGHWRRFPDVENSIFCQFGTTSARRRIPCGRPDHDQRTRSHEHLHFCGRCSARLILPSLRVHVLRQVCTEGFGSMYLKEGQGWKTSRSYAHFNARHFAVCIDLPTVIINAQT